MTSSVNSNQTVTTVGTIGGITGLLGFGGATAVAATKSSRLRGEASQLLRDTAEWQTHAPGTISTDGDLAANARAAFTGKMIGVEHGGWELSRYDEMVLDAENRTGRVPIGVQQVFDGVKSSPDGAIRHAGVELARDPKLSNIGSIHDYGRAAIKVGHGKYVGAATYPAPLHNRSFTPVNESVVRATDGFGTEQFLSGMKLGENTRTPVTVGRVSDAITASANPIADLSAAARSSKNLARGFGIAAGVSALAFAGATVLAHQSDS